MNFLRKKRFDLVVVVGDVNATIAGAITNLPKMV